VKQSTFTQHRLHVTQQTFWKILSCFRKRLQRFLFSSWLLIAEKCLHFWHHAYGSHIGFLNVYKKPRDHKDPYLHTLLWFHGRDEGDQWLYTSVNVEDNYPYQVRSLSFVSIFARTFAIFSSYFNFCCFVFGKVVFPQTWSLLQNLIAITMFGFGFKMLQPLSWLLLIAERSYRLFDVVKSNMTLLPVA